MELPSSTVYPLIIWMVPIAVYARKVENGMGLNLDVLVSEKVFEKVCKYKMMR